MVLLFKKRLSNLSVVEGSDAGQNTNLLTCILTCMVQPCGKMDSSKENPLHLPVGTRHVVEIWQSKGGVI